VEVKMVKYVELREYLYPKDKCGLSYLTLQEKALKYAKKLGLDIDFKASPG